MAYCVVLTVSATFAFPLAPIVVPGHWTVVPLPTVLFHVELTALKYLVNQLVVPELSDLRTLTIAWFGRFTLGFKDVMAWSFQFVMAPKYMLAMTAPVKCRPVETPGRLCVIVIAPIVSGMCTAFGAAALWEAVNAASVHAKSTVLLVKDDMPDPLPTPW